MQEEINGMHLDLLQVRSVGVFFFFFFFFSLSSTLSCLCNDIRL